MGCADVGTPLSAVSRFVRQVAALHCVPRGSVAGTARLAGRCVQAGRPRPLDRLARRVAVLSSAPDREPCSLCHPASVSGVQSGLAGVVAESAAFAHRHGKDKRVSGGAGEDVCGPTLIHRCQLSGCELFSLWVSPGALSGCRAARPATVTMVIKRRFSWMHLIAMRNAS